MSKSFFPAVATALVLGASCIPATLPAAESQGTVTGAVAKPMAAAKEAYDRKNWSETITRSKELLAISGRPALVTYAAYGYLAAAYQAQGNKAELINALQGQLDSGHATPAQQAVLTRSILSLYADQKNYAQVVEFGNKLIRNGNADPSTYEIVADALDKQPGKQAEAVKFLGDYVASVEKAGQTPRESTLVNLRALYSKQSNNAAATDVTEKLVNYYPKATYWELLTYQLSRGAKLTDRQSLQIYRLKVATNTLKRCQDYSEMEEMAVANGMVGEAQKVIEQALAAKVCAADKSGEDRLKRHLGANNNVLNEDKAKFPKLEADARAAKTGELDVAVGAQLFGYGEYQKAADALSRGIAKGGLKDPADAQLTLATAQYRANNKPEALKTLRSIKSNDPTTQRIVRLWLLYAQ